MNSKNIVTINCGSEKFPKIISIAEHHGYKTTSINLQDANQWDFSESTAVIISGGPHLFTESPQKHDQLMQSFQFLKHLELPTLGICLGHQAIALTFGGQVYRGEERRISDNITIIAPHPLFTSLPSNQFSEDHCEGIHPSDSMHVLAQSDHYSVEAFQITDRPFLGVQFHPETSGEQGSQLMGNFLLWAEQQAIT
ncbi:type 1 glutamine amidotransferase [Endozoicomonas lisbonensis]|uniref:GMP synthase-like glutamine amidotransferase n=1 Tax=Endozoicomonas lisbonensis TaxID=3120522 RepID=A0ABV2SLE1_9GAMM